MNEKIGHIKTGFAFALIAFLFCSALLVSYGFYTRFSDTNTRRIENARAWRSVLCDIEAQTLDNNNYSLQVKQTVLLFYDGLLVNDIHTEGCGFTVTQHVTYGGRH